MTICLSLMSATAFRDGRLKEEFAALRAKSERARQVAAFAKEGLSMSEAAAVRLAETVFDELEQPGFAASLTAEEKDTYSKIINRGRASDQRATKLEADLRLAAEREAVLVAEREDRERRKAELATTIVAAKRGGLTKETLAKIEEAAGLL